MEPTSTTYTVDGVCSYAARHLVNNSTLAPYIITTHRDSLFGSNPVYQFTINPDTIPFGSWGSATQLLWEFLGSLVTRGVQVSIYEMLSRLDTRNTKVVFEALELLRDDIRR